jgi:archaellum component FlaC
MTDNELLLSISNMLDRKLDARLNPIENRIKRIEVDLLESKVIPRLNTIESCYTSTYDRYKDSIEEYEALKQDINIMKKVISEHSEKLQKLA